MNFKPKLLITGANGFIGAALITKLFAAEDWRDAIFWYGQNLLKRVW